MADDDAAKIDPAVVAEWYVRFSSDLRGFLLGLLRSPDLAAEALQNTFAQALVCGHQVRSETARGWLFRTAYNQAMLIRRKYQLDQRQLQKAAWQRSVTGDDAVSTEFSPRWDDVEAVRGALSRLPVEQRIVVEKRFYADQTFQQIADELGVPLGTVLTRCRSALRKLKQALHPAEPPSGESGGSSRNDASPPNR